MKPQFTLVEFIQKHMHCENYYKPGNRAYLRDHIAEDLVKRGIAKHPVQQVELTDTVLA